MTTDNHVTPTGDQEQEREARAPQPSRREFLRGASLATAGFFIVPRHVLGRGFTAPSDKLQIAGIGAGGKGADDLRNFNGSGKVDIAYLCDVDDRQAAGSFKAFPNAKRYKDFREMLDKEHRHIDAVSVSTPDNCHAVAAMAATGPTVPMAPPTFLSEALFTILLRVPLLPAAAAVVRSLRLVATAAAISA